MAWKMLGRATKDRKAAFRTPVLATVCADGPQARVLVLRAVDADRRQLIFHTDTRSGKAEQLGDDNRVAVTFYDAHRKIQLRCNGIAQLHTSDALADQQWRDASPNALRCFSGPLPAAACALPSDHDGSEATRKTVAAGRPFFAVLSVDIVRLEWLYLHTHGQRRALFSWEDEHATMHWLNP
ncbi:pyridoxamine 5'-phosphate oxidase family protein [Actimicrobium sp. CCI2.3]|uniref:pyridoxamine 5'-phosphate oxidase family protein n=1 Tax=Actimicrobium sp. CCI2.3 TaxID=3048616 RepID=UPI002AB36FE5|nr:pyridoxamine 5'-phosphate oxidase family protein [Actimicrobium sp. CCI2.3]MDY7572968.1 pyridoxamine 5'-phosphate oxidase family protein [Actimicrobium sp. CCI2.3]MEB0023654.1 pyridoxamine 5'-phosphate oxidase family protein [Actimicrobium sp. CCI2.3]